MWRPMFATWVGLPGRFLPCRRMILNPFLELGDFLARFGDNGSKKASFGMDKQKRIANAQLGIGYIGEFRRTNERKRSTNG
jgi:hypothetical protein